MKKNSLSKFALFILLTCSIHLCAQKGYVWKKLDVPYDSSIIKGTYLSKNLSKNINGDYYVVLHENNDKEIAVYKWNGITWLKYPTLKSNGLIRDIAVFNNEIYLSGRFDTVRITQRSNDLPFAIVKCNGSSWDSLPSSPKKDSSAYSAGSIDNLTVYNGCLYYLSHCYTKVGSQTKLFKMNASGVTSMLQSYHIPLGGEEGILNTHHDKLVLGGSFDTLEFGKPTSGIAFYNGSQFNYYKNSYFNGISALASNGGLPNSGMHSIGDTVLVIHTLEYKLLTLKNEIYYTDITDVNLPTTSIYSIGSKDNLILARYSNDLYYFNIDSNKWIPGRTDRLSFQNGGNNRIYAFRTNSSFPPKVTDFLELVKGSVIEGDVFWDVDSSCANNAGDTMLNGVLILFDNDTTQYYTLSNKNGHYETTVLPSKYKIKPIFPYNSALIAPCVAVNLTVKKDSNYLAIDLPAHPREYRDLETKLISSRGFRHRWGDVVTYVLSGTNYGVKKDSIILSLVYDSMATYVSSSIAPFTHIGNVLTYKLYQLKWLDKKEININFKADTSKTKVNNFLKFRSVLLNTHNDSVTINNDDTLNVKVVSAYDPNIKQCFPEGIVKSGLNKIKYIIQFQNTGTDTAIKVIVVDTISQKLGLRDLRVTATSHPNSYFLRVDNKQTLIWEFNNIMLPDSHINEKASHGFIAFEADVNGKIAVGDSILNKAYIYFDYQKPIITNTASVVVVNSSGESNLPQITNTKNNLLQLFPNPATSTVKVSTAKEFNNRLVSLYNCQGQLISVEIIQDTIANFNLVQFAKGIYFVKIEGTALSGKLIIQ